MTELIIVLKSECLVANSSSESNSNSSWANWIIYGMEWFPLMHKFIVAKEYFQKKKKKPDKIAKIWVHFPYTKVKIM